MTSFIDDLHAGGGEESDSTGILEEFAASNGIDTDLILAVADHESPQGAYDRNGRMPFLPEAHKFYKHLRGGSRQKAVDAGIARRYWGKSAQYKGLGGTGSEARWKRLYAMAEIDETAAIKSCSWGAYQIMGENYRMCGYDSPQEFLSAMASSQRAQDEAFISFVRSADLVDELQRSDLRGFIRGYNGPGQVNAYLGKISAAYRRNTGNRLSPTKVAQNGMLRMSAAGPDVKDLQQSVRKHGFPAVVDGDFGPDTRKYVKAFQANHDLTPDGIAGPNTLEALNKKPVRYNDQREKVTVADLHERKDPVVTYMKKLKQYAATGFGLLTTGAAAEESGAWETIKGYIDLGETLRGVLGEFGDLLIWGKEHWMFILPLMAILIWNYASKAEQHRTDEARDLEQDEWA